MNPFNCFDEIHCINLNAAAGRWGEMQQRFRELGIADRVRRAPAIATPGNHHIGCALSHRRVIETASAHGCRSVLVFEDDALLLDRIHSVLAQALPELAAVDWTLCYLGGLRHGGALAPVPGCRHLERAENITCTHAIAYSERVFTHLLQELPNDIPGMTQWVKQQRAIDQYLRGMQGAVAVRPPVATQAELLPYENPADQFHFTI